MNKEALNKYVDIKINSDWHRDADGKLTDDYDVYEQWEQTDEEMRDIIYILNKKGYVTSHCCQGHYSEAIHGYTETNIWFKWEIFPQEPRLPEYSKHQSFGEKYEEFCEGNYNRVENKICYLKNKHGYLRVEFCPQNAGLTKDEMDAAHRKLIADLKDWAESLEEMNKEKCRRRYEWMSRLDGFVVNYDEHPEWNEFSFVAETDVDLDQEWKEKWLPFVDTGSAQYYDYVVDGQFKNGYKLGAVVYFNDDNEMILPHCEEKLEDLFKWVTNIYTKRKDEIKECILFVNHNGRLVDDGEFLLGEYCARPMDEIRVEDLIELDMYLAENIGTLPDLEWMEPDFRIEVEDEEKSLSPIYKWLICDADRDTVRVDEDGEELDYNLYSMDEIVDKLNKFIDESWTLNSTGVNLYVKTIAGAEYEKVELSAGKKVHLDKKIFRLLEKKTLKNAVKLFHEKYSV